VLTTYSDLAGKCYLITGATRGIGKGIARALAEQQAYIVFNFRGDEKIANELKEELLQLGAKGVFPLQFDLNNFTQTKNALEQHLKVEGPIHGLINNAGISKDQLCLRIKEEDIDQTLNINLKGTMLLTNYLCRNFLRNEHSSIVNISSVVGLMGNTGQTVYAASKAGIIGYTKSLAKELASKNVRVNALCPGFISTEMTAGLDEKTKEQYKTAIPLADYGQVQDVAQAVLFLLSTASKYITGEVIKVDGGLYI
jgi:3-oxoacyl-[acyl-carrier protein] reductase